VKYKYTNTNDRTGSWGENSRRATAGWKNDVSCRRNLASAIPCEMMKWRDRSPKNQALFVASHSILSYPIPSKHPTKPSIHGSFDVSTCNERSNREARNGVSKPPLSGIGWDSNLEVTPHPRAHLRIDGGKSRILSQNSLLTTMHPSLQHKISYLDDTTRYDTRWPSTGRTSAPAPPPSCTCSWAARATSGVSGRRFGGTKWRRISAKPPAGTASSHPPPRRHPHQRTASPPPVQEIGIATGYER